MRSHVRIIQRILKAVGLGAVALPVAIMFFWQLFLLLYGPPDAAFGSTTPTAVESFSAITNSDSDAPCDVMPDAVLTDDAGCTCSAAEIQVVELRVQSDGTDYRGHAFLKTPNMAVGFLTDATDLGLIDFLNPFSPPVPGHLRDDSEHPYNYAARFRACPLTVKRIEESIARHSRDPYQVGNWAGGRNCATWTQDRLRDAGLPPPSGKCPNQMAWNMRACGDG